MKSYIKKLAMVGAMISSSWLLASDVDDVIRLKQAGVGDDVLIAYIQNNGGNEEVSDSDIKRLEDEQVPASVIVSMADHKQYPAPQDEPQPLNASYGNEQYANDTYAPDADATVVYAPPKEDMNISFFYESLGNEGKWRKSAQYGYVWQPAEAVAVSDWQPYSTGGHWIWTDQGWYFESNYKWGWAAYHYGRWSHDNDVGWVWVPGTEWAPSWVSWRQNDQYYGWAPLPPEAEYQANVGFSFRNKHVGVDFNFGLADRDYTFVPCDRFLSVDIGRVAVSHRDRPTIYNKTTIVNNTYIYNDNRIINNGVPRSQVAARTRTTVETVQINDVRGDAGAVLTPERRNGQKINVYRPQIERAAPVTPDVAIRRRQERVATRQAVQAQNRERRETNQRQAQERLTQIKQQRAVRQQTSAQVKQEKAQDRAVDRQEKAADRQEATVQRQEQARQRQEQARDMQEQARANREQAQNAREQKQDQAKDIRAQQQEQSRAQQEQLRQQREQQQAQVKDARVQQQAQAKESREQKQEQAKDAREQKQEQARQRQEDAKQDRAEKQAARKADRKN